MICSENRIAFYTAGSRCAVAPPPADPSCAANTRDWGPCDGYLGVTWNGSACVPQTGCLCEGECEGLYVDADECTEAHAHCG